MWLLSLQGALTNIYLCSSPDVEGISGKYYDSCKPVTSTPASYDTASAAKLWQVSEELTQAYAKTTAAV
jgi:retinol dehydrogenase-14